MTANEQIEVITGEYNPNGGGPNAIQPIQTAAKGSYIWGVAFPSKSKGISNRRWSRRAD